MNLLGKNQEGAFKITEFFSTILIQSSKSSCKTRTIAADVVSNYKTKLTEIENKVKKIIDLENEEAAFAAAENQINRAQNKLEHKDNKKREWYQDWFNKINLTTFDFRATCKNSFRLLMCDYKPNKICESF